MTVTDSSYEALKTYYTDVLNKDRTTFKTSNDEPTPIACVEEMLRAVPEEVWGREDLKILDPCCGNGNFPLVIYDILRARGVGSDRILGDILHFNDVSVERIAKVREVFQGATNISTCDFLSTEYPVTERYDLVVANPPYAKILANGARASKNHNMIKDFLERSLALLKPGGYLLFISPDNWMSYADRNKIIGKLTRLQIHHLNIHTAKKYFKKVGSSFTWYVVENKVAYKDMRIEGIYKGLSYKSSAPSEIRKYIPLFYTREVHGVLGKTLDATWPRFGVETSSDLHRYTKRDLIAVEKDAVYSHRLIHTPKQTVYAKRAHKYQDGYKVFLSTTDKYNVFVDNCGMTQSIAFIRVNNKEEAERIKTILSHPLYRFLNDICRWGNFNNIRVLQLFPVPRDDKDVWGSFGITEEEKGFIAEHT